MKLGRLNSKPTVTLVAVLEYVLMLFVLLYSSMWALFTSANCNTFFRLSYPLLAALIFLRLRGRAILAPRWKRLVIVAAFLAVYALCTRYNPVRFGLYYFIPLILLMLYMGLTDDRGACISLLFKLSDIVTVLSVISLFCFIFGTCLGALPGRSVATYNWAEATRTCGTYFHLYYESQSIIFLGRDLVRNCGLFMEAPGFAVFLVYAAAVEMLLREKLRLWRCAILYVTALTTFSAKAILLVVLICGLRYVIRRSRTILSHRFKLVILPAVLVAVALVAVVLIADKMTSASYYIRLDDVQACIKTWLTRPLFGTGYWNDDSVIPFFTYEGRYNDGLSMGFAVILAQGGVYLLTLYLLPMLWCIRRTRGFDRACIAAFFLAYTGLMFITNMPYSYLALFTIAFALEYGHRAPTDRRIGGTNYADRQHS